MRMSTCTSYFQKLEAYTFVAASMGLSIFKFGQWAPKDKIFPQECVLAIQGCSRSAKVDDFVKSMYATMVTVLSCTVSEIWQLIVRNCLFFLPVSHLAPPLSMFALEFHAEVNHEETTVTGYPPLKTT